MKYRNNQLARQRPSGGKKMLTIGAYKATGKVAQYAAKKLGQAARKYVKKKKTKKQYTQPSFAIQHDHDGINTTQKTVTLRKYKKSKTKVGHWVTYRQQNSDVITDQAGAQAIGIMSIDFTAHNVSTRDTTVADGPAPHLYAMSLFNMNPSQGGVPQSGTTVNVNPWPSVTGPMRGGKMFIKSIKYEVQIYNSQTSAAEVTFYLVTNSKQQHNGIGGGAYNATAFNKNAMGILGESSTIHTIKRQNLGIVQANNATITSGTYAAPTFGDFGLGTHGFTPFQLEGIRKSYKRLIVKRMNLNSGATHKLYIKVNVNKWINEEEVLASSEGANTNIIPFTTMQMFLIAKGQPVAAETAGVNLGVVDRVITTAPTQIFWTTVKTISFGFAPGNSSKMNYIAANFPVTLGTTTARIINEDTGIEESVNQILP